MTHNEASEAGHTRRPYFTVFIILAVFTALEVGASYLPANIKVPVLIILAVSKALLVILYFMHLKFDNRLFALPFIFGAILVIPIILIMTLVMPYLR